MQAWHRVLHPGWAERTGMAPGWQDHRGVRLEGIMLAHMVSGCAHGVDDVIGDPVAADIAERPCKPSGNGAVSAFQKPVQYFRGIAHPRQGGAHVGGMLPGVSRRAGDQGRREGEQTQTVLFHNILFVRQCGADIQ